MAAAPRGLPPGYGRGGGAPYNGRGGQRGSPVGGLVSIATNLLLQLPFSRYVAHTDVSRSIAVEQLLCEGVVCLLVVL
jgi:hypothetical protein